MDSLCYKVSHGYHDGLKLFYFFVIVICAVSNDEPEIYSYVHISHRTDGQKDRETDKHNTTDRETDKHNTTDKEIDKQTNII